MAFGFLILAQGDAHIRRRTERVAVNEETAQQGVYTLC
jgi:hypothetical protein